MITVCTLEKIVISSSITLISVYVWSECNIALAGKLQRIKNRSKVPTANLPISETCHVFGDQQFFSRYTKPVEGHTNKKEWTERWTRLGQDSFLGQFDQQIRNSIFDQSSVLSSRIDEWVSSARNSIARQKVEQVVFYLPYV